MQSLAPGEAELLDGIAGHILNICGDELPQFAEDYSWLCEQQLTEELFFRRNNRYRLSTFAEAYDQVYSNKDYMTRYMNGLLFTQLWWSNHTGVMGFINQTLSQPIERDILISRLVQAMGSFCI